MFDITVYEDSLFALLDQGSTQASAVLNQSIVSSELVEATIPPGVHADHGVLLFQQGKIAEAVIQLSKEREKYPESTKMVRQLLTIIQKAGTDEEAPSEAISKRSPSILLFPVLNSTGKPEAGLAFHLTLSRQFIERGYYVFPIVATHRLLKNAGVDFDDATKTELTTIRSLTGTDSVLYVTVTEWEKAWKLLPFIRVRAEYRLIDASTGHEIWRSTVTNQYDPTFVVGAGPTPLYASYATSDFRIPARSLTRKAITASENGLPYGPYH
ncbi:MAG: DUF799 family lipoprotein [Nitrospira sp.]|nr:DUF799 family lipoprotein [Nitrospira sp.]